MSLAGKFLGGSSHGCFFQFSVGYYANPELPLAEKKELYSVLCNPEFP